MTAIRVLIVDDVPLVRQDLCTVLVLAGDAGREHPVDGERSIEIVGEAENGLQAINQAETLQPEVILMDLEMPVLDGYEATRQIKTLYPACRVLALSVHDYEAARQKAFQAGVDDFIVKGVSVRDLIQAILK